MSTPNDTDQQAPATDDARKPVDGPSPDDALDPNAIEELPEDETAKLSTVKERNRELKRLREQATAREQELDDLRRQNMDDQERAIQEAYDRGKQEGTTEYRGAYAEARLTGLAAGRLADPTDALRYLPSDLVSVDASDEDITEAIDALLEQRPYLGNAAPQAPSVDAGVRGRGPAPTKEEEPSDWLRSRVPRG